MHRKKGGEDEKKKKTNCAAMYTKANWILLGLLMLISGLSKLFVATPEGIAGFLSSLGFPIAGFFAWILILAEILSGAAILANYKIEKAKWIPAIILLVAILTAHLNDFQGILIRLVLLSNYLILKQR